MNRTDKIIAALLFAILLAWLWHVQKQQAARTQLASQQTTTSAISTQAAVTASIAAVPGSANPAPVTAPAATVTNTPALPRQPEKTAFLHTPEMNLLISSRGATLHAVTLLDYRATENKTSGPVILDFNPQPALELSGLPGLPPDADYTLTTDASNRVATLTCRTPQNLTIERRIEFTDRYQLLVTDRIGNAGTQPVTLGSNSVSMGSLYRGSSKTDDLAIDSFASATDSKVRHWSKDFSELFGVKGGFGCLGGSSQILPDEARQHIDQPQQWIALKSRFFAETLASSEPNAGFSLVSARNTTLAQLSVRRVDASLMFAGTPLAAGEGLERSYRLYIGPKKLSCLETMGNHMDEIMEFGRFSWFCKPLMSILNFFYRMIPNYGVAIILLTLLVRIVFWPLTHKSTESAKRMREVQPKIKALQEQFKDNPQKMQQEVWKVYRENKVNPFSSCLPMLVQLPVFYALYSVLRSAVELRFASFLWVADLSQPENLFASSLPLPLNILPLLMAATTVWQSKLTPSMGDPAQQKMMTWMMPLMMLFFFYAMPSALSLYWTVSTLLAVIQLAMQQRGGNTPGDGLTPAATPAESMTRQMKRRLER